MEEQELYMCPQCGEIAMHGEGQNMKCDKCGVEIPADILMMSLELLEKQIAVHALRQFFTPGMGKCIQYNGMPYIVGFNGNDQLMVMEHILKDDQEIGMYVQLVDKIKYDEAIEEQQK